ncbi:sialate O-acetylesterase isoform X2 [Ascaphus truei]|uniref:sialate O-acetylesterase isoform X2 n=1 Tax=Ascaphus truei TaxID=8439 RepID=UPI003F594F00
MKMTRLVLLFLSLSLVFIADSEFQFASYYGDYMVLQKEPSKALIWGYGDVGANITVSIFKGLETITKKAVQINENPGIWKVLLDPMHDSGPYRLVAKQYYKEKVQSITLQDILFGDVWLCSGQSNMEMTVSQIFNASKELAEAAHYPHVRLFAAALTASQTELRDLAKVDLQWSLPTAENLGNGDFTYFSAVCWLFGRYLSDTLKYPIGLVASTWGGTPVEAWSSKRSLEKCGLSENVKTNIERSPFPELVAGPCDYSVLWNAMIHPLLNMTIKGAIWYQALIEDWRKSFYDGTEGQTERYFPFGFVQLSTYQKKQQNDMFPVIRWHQTADYGFAPNAKMINTFMAVAMDLCDEESPYGSIHPRDKQNVAYRLLLGARAVAYGDPNIAFQGPFPNRMIVVDTGSYINITYNQKLLTTHLSDNIYEVFCNSKMNEDKEDVFDWIPAVITSASSNLVTVSFKGCQNVTGIRYAWVDWPCEYKQCPFYSIDGILPAPPFVKYFTN